VLARKRRSPILAVFRRPDAVLSKSEIGFMAMARDTPYDAVLPLTRQLAEALGVEWRIIDYE